MTATTSDPVDAVVLPGHVLPALSDARVVSSVTPRAATDDALDAVTLTVILRRNDPAGFERYLAEVYDARGPHFRQFVNAQELSDRFGPFAEDYEAVEAFFASLGFTVVERSANRLTLALRAPRDVVERSLHVTIGDYALGDRRFRANDRDPALPAAIATRVQAMIGLSDLARPRPAIQWFNTRECIGQAESAGYIADNVLQPALKPCEDMATKCSADKGLNAENTSTVKSACAKFDKSKPKTLSERALPAGAPAWKDASGAGQKVGLVQFDTFLMSDVADFAAYFGMPDDTLARLSQVHVNGGATLGADQSEVLLDITAVLLGAPGAQVVVYDAPFTGAGSFQALFNRALADGMTIISNSWSYCEDQTTLADVQSIDAILATAAGAGISVLNASGDTGSTCLDGSPNTIGVPAGSPHATAVGGTTLETGPTAIYASETWWNAANDSPPGGQGGFGTSRFFARPVFQDGLTASPMRSIPDIAMSADPSGGVILCQASAGGCPTGLLYGGTSVAAPTLAAGMAVVNEAVGHNLGNLNLALYPLAGTSALHTPASMGSDFAHVGLGSPNLNLVYRALTGQAAGPVSPTVTDVAVEHPVVPADGSTTAFVVVRLRDADGNTVSGKTVSLAAAPAGGVVIAPSSGVSNVANGAVVFAVTSATPQIVTFTATDTSDGIVITQQASIEFAVPPAQNGGIGAGPTSVLNNGVATTTITVTLTDASNRPTPGKVVSLAQGAGHSIVTAPSPSVTDANGQIRFTATNTIAETVTYTAVDVSDGNLPVPGSATVTFGGQGSFSCVPGPAPTAAAGFTLTPFTTGYATQSLFYGNVNWGCRGAQNPAFAPDGGVLVANFTDGSLFRLPPQGGVADSGTRIATLGPTLFAPVVGKDGRVYVARGATTGNWSTGAIYEVDPVTGAVVRTVIGNLTCPTMLQVDPVSGDLFFDDSCFGAGADNPSLWRVVNPGGASPQLTVYATLPSTPASSLAFAPDGTLFVPQALASGAQVLRISGTNQPQPPTVAAVPGVTTLYWVTVARADATGAATGLIVQQNGTTRLVDITTNPPTYTDLVHNGLSSGVVGPDGCLYVEGLDKIFKVTAAGGGCDLIPTSPAPALRLSPPAASAVQGNPMTLAAQFSNIAVPSDTPVYFYVDGANPQVLMARTDAQGRATVAFTGVASGADRARAAAFPATVTLQSNIASITWTAGQHATLLTLNGGPTTGTVGKPLTLRATLADISLTPQAAVANATVTLTVGGQSCTTTTNANGVASCAVTPSAAGSADVVATYAGNASYRPASAKGSVLLLAATSSLAPSPLSLAFGNVALGTTSATQTVTLVNAGTLPYTIASLTLTGTQAGDFARVAGTNACAVATVIAAGGSCTLYVTFAPGAIGAREATLVVSDGNPALDVPVALAGTGVAAAAVIGASPPALDFGPVVVGTSSPVKSVTLTNAGGVAFALSSLRISGPHAADFTFNKGAGGCAPGGTIPAGGGTCTVYLSFRPGAVGARSASLDVMDPSGRVAVAVSLAGTGLSTGTGEIQASPATLAFGNQAVARTSAAQAAVLINIGSTPFTISGVAIGGPQAVDFALSGGANLCTAGGILAAHGGTCTLYVAFTPSATGPRAASLTVSGSGPAPAIALTGTGTSLVPPRVTVQPSALAFGRQAVGAASAALAVVVSNPTTTPLSVAGFVVSGAQASDFALQGGANACTTGGVLAAGGGSCTLYVAFTPGAPGSRVATLVVNVGGDAVPVPVSGTGVVGTRSGVQDAGAAAIPALDPLALALLACLLAVTALRVVRTRR